MNIDFAAVGGTAVTVAGATIFACKITHYTLFSYISLIFIETVLLG